MGRAGTLYRACWPVKQSKRILAPKRGHGRLRERGRGLRKKKHANRSATLSNWSLTLPVRISEFAEQRPAPKSAYSGADIAQILAQRLHPLPLTPRNIADSSTRGDHAVETGLGGCPGRIRTALCRSRTGLFNKYKGRTRVPTKMIMRERWPRAPAIIP
jgi:hypothetical protein